MDGIKGRIKYLRKKHGLTMAEFSARIHVSPGNVGDWESEKRSSTPGTKALIAIAEEFKVSLDWLLLGKVPSGTLESPDNGEERTPERQSEGEAAPYQPFQTLMSIASKLSTKDVDLLSQVASRFKTTTRDI
ncbi:helix-turn-helix domain-containing protein [Paenibacillus sp. CAU 1782]